VNSGPQWWSPDGWKRLEKIWGSLRGQDWIGRTEIKTKIIQLLVFFDDERGKYARQYIFTYLDEGRSLEKTKKLAH